MRVKQGQAAIIPVVLTSPTDRLTEKTGVVNPAIWAGKNGGVDALVAGCTWLEAGAVNSPGRYWLTIPAAQNNVIGAVAGTVTKQATNYLPYSSFEVDSNADGLADGWSKTGGLALPTCSLSATLPTDGTYAQRIQYTGIAGDSGKTAMIDQFTASGSFAAGETAVGSMTLRGMLTGCTLQIVLYARNDANSNLGSVVYSVPLSATNARYSVTYPNLPAGTTKLQLRLNFASIDNGDSLDVYADATQVQKDSLTAYIFTAATIASAQECAPFHFTYDVAANTEADAVASANAAKASADAAPTAAVIADAVWDEQLNGAAHMGINVAGELVAAARWNTEKIPDQVWNTLSQKVFTAGSVGELIKENINAPINALATLAKQDTAATSLAALIARPAPTNEVTPATNTSGLATITALAAAQSDIIGAMPAGTDLTSVTAALIAQTTVIDALPTLTDITAAMPSAVPIGYVRVTHDTLGTDGLPLGHVAPGAIITAAQKPDLTVTVDADIPATSVGAWYIDLPPNATWRLTAKAADFRPDTTEVTT